MTTKDICVSTDGNERRFLASTIEYRASKRADSIGTVYGYAAKYNELSQDFGGWKERIAKGFFRGVMADDCRCLFNHRSEAILGRTTAGTLRMTDDDVGLYYECDLPDTQCGRDTRVSVLRRDLTGCSFAFRIADEGGDMWQWDDGSEYAIRTLTTCSRLYDVGPVTYPAYESTEVDSRSFERALQGREADSTNPVSVSISLAQARLRLAAAAEAPGA